MILKLTKKQLQLIREELILKEENLEQLIKIRDSGEDINSWDIIELNDLIKKYTKILVNGNINLNSPFN